MIHISSDMKALLARLDRALQALAKPSSSRDFAERHRPARSRYAHKSSASARVRAIPRIIVFGASTGGPTAFQKLLPQMPSDLPVPILIVQHMPAGFSAHFARHLACLCRIRVREAQQGDLLEPATVYIAPSGIHTKVYPGSGSNPFLYLSKDPAQSAHKPSVDVTMSSVAEAFGAHALGAILTGMGSDGLSGMTAIHRAGGMTIGQDEESSTVYGMPRVCAESGILDRVLSLSQFPACILSALGHRSAG